MSSKKGQQYDLDANGSIGLKGIATAVILQAVSDWRYLCDDGSERGNLNFAELERFFTRDCGKLICDSVTTQEEIWNQMQRERMLAGK